MAKTKGIFKQKKSRYYWIRYADAYGKIVRESTMTTDHKHAETILIDKKNAIRKGQEPEQI